MIDFGEPEKLARILDGMVPRNDREAAALEAGAMAIRDIAHLFSNMVRVPLLTPESGQEIMKWLRSEDST